MATENGYLEGPGQTKLFYQSWLPENPTRAALIAVHGLAEHGGRYMNLVNNLVPKGFGVYAPDHYGHGKSQGKRLFVERFQVFLDDLDRLVDKVKEWEPDKPVFLVGHSMGATVMTLAEAVHEAIAVNLDLLARERSVAAGRLRFATVVRGDLDATTISDTADHWRS